MRIAMFGGSFNPIHNGHIEIARAVREKYDIDRMLIMVANDPPHKMIADGVTASERMEMTRLALKDEPGIEASDMELRRTGKSYTVDTLHELHTLYPNDEICCVMGADMLLTIDTWHNAPELLKSARFIAVGRPASGSMEQKAEELREKYGAYITISNIMGPDISSTLIRERVEKGESIAELLPGDTAEYIYQKGFFMPEGIDRIRLRLREELAPDRYAHTMRVTMAAIELAAKYGINTQKARLGGLLHDCAKLSHERQAALAAEYDVDISELPRPVIHGPIGAERARREYGIEDGEILSAIACHTICKAEMSPLDKVVYLADKIERGRYYAGIEGIRAAAYRSLDEGMIAGIEHGMAYLEEKGEQAHPDTLRLLKKLKEQIKMMGGFGLEQDSKALALKLCEALYDKKALDIRAINVGDKTIIAEWFVVCSGRATTQVKSLCDEMENKAAEIGLQVIRKEGYNEGRWIVLDLGFILVHIFHPEERQYYNMERLWDDDPQKCIDYSKEQGE